jgi:hypothetical protein
VTGKMTGSCDPRGTLYFPKSPVAITLLVVKSYNLASRCENWTGRYELVESAKRQHDLQDSGWRSGCTIEI